MTHLFISAYCCHQSSNICIHLYQCVILCISYLHGAGLTCFLSCSFLLPVLHLPAACPMPPRLSAVQFSAGSGTKCLNLNPEIWLRFECKPSVPEVQNLIWAKYGKRSPKNFPANSPNLWFRCRFSQNGHLPHLKPEPWVQFRFTSSSGGL
jgi:hypothetical protein